MYTRWPVIRISFVTKTVLKYILYIAKFIFTIIKSIENYLQTAYSIRLNFKKLKLVNFSYSYFLENCNYKMLSKPLLFSTTVGFLSKLVAPKTTYVNEKGC